MTPRINTILVLLAVASTVAVASSQAQDKFRLKPGAKGKVCLTCHDSFKEKLKFPYLHTPVKAGDCSDCHNPHTSSHGKLLSEGPNRICFSCHEGIVPGKARSAHKVAAEGNGVKCHDPHGAKNKNNRRSRQKAPVRRWRACARPWRHEGRYRLTYGAIFAARSTGAANAPSHNRANGFVIHD